jgi:hypothetical protein
MHENHKKQLKALEKGKVKRTVTKTKTTGYNVFVKEKFNEIGEQHKDLTNAEIMKIVGGRWKALSKQEQKPYCDLADSRNVSNENPVVSSSISCAWCDRTFKNKNEAKKHMKEEHMATSTGNQLNRLQPDQNQDHIKKCDVCGLMLNERTMDDHIKTHGTVSHQEHEVADAVEISNEEPEVTLEESVVNEMNEDNSEVEESVVNEMNEDNFEVTREIIMVRMRTKYWPAEVVGSSSDSYDVILCKRGDRLAAKKADCKVFVPGPEICKGQSREWKECYKTALEIIDQTI